MNEALIFAMKQSGIGGTSLAHSSLEKSVRNESATRKITQIGSGTLMRSLSKLMARRIIFGAPLTMRAKF